MATTGAYGTLNTMDTMQALRISNGTVIAYGADDVWSIVRAALVAHNQLMAEQLSMLCSFTSQRLIRYGNASSKQMQELDEFGNASAQKGRGGSEVGFPIRRFGNALAWNNDYFKMTTTKDFAGEIDQIFSADIRNIIAQIKRAFYGAANYSFEDMLYDHAVLPIKRLANADSAELPLGPNGETFTASTHQHYLARVSTFAQSDLVGLLNTVTEHYDGGEVMIVLHSDNETAVRAFTDFIPLPYEGTQIVLSSSGGTLSTSGETINAFNNFNRKIGTFRGASVWVKPWAISNYIVAMVMAPGIEKPLAVRVPAVLGSDGAMGSALPSILNGGSATEPGMGDLEFVHQFNQFPMYCNQYRRQFGIAVRNRVSAAVLYVGGTSYVVPTITA